MTYYYTLNQSGGLDRLELPIVINGQQRLHPTPAEAAELTPPAYPRNDAYYPTEPPPSGKRWQRSNGYTLRGGEWCANFEAVDVSPPPLEDYDAAMEEHLRRERENRGYTTREPDAYLASGVARWAADAADWVRHRDAVMAYALGVLNAVRSGSVEPPALDVFCAGLPDIAWSYAED